MLCKVCTNGLQGIWDPRKTERVCLMQDFVEDHPPREDSKFVIEEWTYKTAEPHDPQSLDPEKYVFGHHRTQQSFEKSIRDGCVMCQIFGPRSDDTQTTSDSNIATYGYYSLFSIMFQDCPTMSLYVNDSSGGFELCRHTDDKNWNLDISPSTGDNATWAIIQSWLDNCVKSHGRCNETVGPASMPTRLIHLDNSSGQETNFRLVLGTQVEPGTRYIALSHCCDDENELHLTKSLLEQLSTFQPISMIPLTFRDILVIAARLDITHVWIDRLCTLQDDPDEQIIDMNKRSDVFRNAFLAVGASGTTSATSGMFATRDPALVAPTVFDFPIDAQGTTAPYISSCEHPKVWESAFHDDPLSRSATAVGDRLFAPRMIHFGSKMVFWECSHARCAEIHPDGAYKPALGSIYLIFGLNNEQETSQPESEWTYKPWKSLLGAYSRQTEYGPIHQVFFDWSSLIRVYSECKATQKERLHELSGIAKHMKAMLQERGCTETEYVAGMWKATLPASLMWNTFGAGTRHPACQVPSWSWASVDGEFNMRLNEPYNGNPDELLCEVVSLGEAPCDEGQDSTEAPSKKSLVLKGKLARAKLNLRMGSPSFDEEDNAKVMIRHLVNVDHEDICLGEPAPESENACEWTVLFDTDEDISEETVCLPIETELSEGIGYLVRGLALSRLDSGCYVRRGVWTILVDSEEEGLSIFRGLPEKIVELV